MVRRFNPQLKTPLMIVAFLILAGCAAMEAYMPYEGIIRRASQVRLFEVRPNATDPAQQLAGVNYVGNYEVERELPLTVEQQREIKNLVLDPSLYQDINTKSCLHQGKYALSFEYRQQADLTVVISTSPCSKAYVTPKGGVEELYDLPVNHPLEQVLAKAGQ